MRIEEKSVQVKWPIINTNEKQNENLLSLQQLKEFESKDLIPLPLMINENQASLLDNFDLIKQRYSTLADLNLSRGELLFIFSSIRLFVDNRWETITNCI